MVAAALLLQQLLHASVCSMRHPMLSIFFDCLYCRLRATSDLMKPVAQRTTLCMML
jgi:hypothetical protein